MAQKSKSASWSRLAGFMAFFAIMVSGVVFLIDALVGLFGGSFDLGVVSQIASIFLILSVWLSGWQYLSNTKLPGKRIVWLVLFVVFAILALVGVFSV